VGPDGLSAHPEALRAIAAADQIVIGPGSLYTSVLAVLLVPGIAEAVMANPKMKVFVLNLIGQDGETLGLTGADHLEALSRLGQIAGPGVVVAQEGPVTLPPDGELSPGMGVVALTDDEALRWSWSVVRGQVANPAASWPEHDPFELGKRLAELV
jgi:uncharacterized cofD-like protein